MMPYYGVNVMVMPHGNMDMMQMQSMEKDHNDHFSTEMQCCKGCGSCEACHILPPVLVISLVVKRLGVYKIKETVVSTLHSFNTAPLLPPPILA